MMEDGTLTFTLINGVSSPINITQLEVIYLGQKCQREIICQTEGFNEVIKIEPSEVRKVTAYCPDIHQDAVTDAYIYIRITYETVDAKDEKNIDTRAGLFLFPVK